MESVRTFGTLVRRELTAYFLSPLAYVFIGIFGLVTTFFFGMVVKFLSDPASGGSLQHFLWYMTHSEIHGFFFVIGIPALTMRLIADEVKTGTIEVLLTAPIRDGTVVLAKFMACLLLMVVMWLPTVAFFVILNRFSNPGIDWGIVGALYLYAFLWTAMLVSIGLFTSSVTSNPVTSALLAAGVIFLYLYASLFAGNMEQFAPFLKKPLDYISFYRHGHSVSGYGLVDLRDVIFYLSVTSVMVYGAIRMLGVRRWR